MSYTTVLSDAANRLSAASGAFLGSDSVKGRPALLHLLAAAAGTDNLTLLIFDQGQDLREGLLAGTTKKLVVRHTDLPRTEE
jgi:hypothetical protein